MIDAKNRFLVIRIVLVVMIVALVAQLFNLQIIQGQDYYELSQRRMNASVVDKAPRGEILDRYGKPMITNRIGYSLQLQKTEISDARLNDVLAETVRILNSTGYTTQDTLPISGYPYEYTFADENGDGSAEDEKAAWFQSKTRITSDMSAAQVMEYYKKNSFGIPDGYEPQVERQVIGIRYEASLRGFSANSPFTLAEDVDMAVISKIKERQDEFPGIVVTQDYVRNYEMGQVAAHILGGIGKMSQEEYDAMRGKGYSYNDIIGKRGVEKLFEEYLRGEDGTNLDSTNLSGVVENVAPVPGDYVVLTLDADLQKAAEESLEKHIQALAARTGGETDAGAVVVLDVRNGDVLVSATYPTYNPATFNRDYQSLLENDANPIWNRALSGTYTPGSTFKPLTAIAALESGAVTAEELLRCDGIYRYYKDYQPRCWIWSETGRTHGALNVTKAIEQSCNCYFYEAGRRMGIDTIDQYAAMFGLGELTGIELPDEVEGNVSSPAYKERVGKTEEDKMWYPGDTIQTAIGQSYSFFTPIQLANYIATIANGGTRYKTHILKSVRSSTDGSVIYEQEPEVLAQVGVKEKTLEAVKRGMLGVVDEGSASGIFADYPVAVGGKTGTAQVGNNVGNNALFVAFAPYDDPEIAICVVLEHGETGMNAAYIARDIFDAYFLNGEETDLKIKVGELLP